jgi:hypothetical protein
MYSIVEKKTIIIQKAYRHHLKGKKHRLNLNIKYFNILLHFKPFKISHKLDSIYTPHKLYVKNIINYLNHWTHYDDNENNTEHNLTQSQHDLVQTVLNQKHIYKKDIKKILKTLTLTQIMCIH